MRESLQPLCKEEPEFSETIKKGTINYASISFNIYKDDAIVLKGLEPSLKPLMNRAIVRRK
jgi:hypothetical protein